MTEQIELGGKLRPISFAFRQQRHYEEIFNRPFAKDLQELMKQFAPMFATKDKEEMVGLAADISLVTLGNMFYSALVCGHHLEKRVVDFDVYDVTDWMMEDDSKVEKLTMMLLSANTSSLQSVTVDASKKKTKIHRKSG